MRAVTRVRDGVGIIFGLLAVLALGGCQKKAAPEPTSAATLSGETARPGSYLAYEHIVGVELAAGVVAARADAVRSACTEQRFGACSVLGLDEQSGERPRVQLVMRLAPDVVESTVALAAEGGGTSSRQLKAEDLAEVVADTQRQRVALLAQGARLQEFAARKDLSAADLIALAAGSADIETRLQAIERAAADQQRRVETNLLTLNFSTSVDSEGRGARLAAAFGDFGDGLVDGVGEVLELLGFGIPFLLVAFPLALGWRWAWRKAVGTRAR